MTKYKKPLEKVWSEALKLVEKKIFVPDKFKTMTEPKPQWTYSAISSDRVRVFRTVLPLCYYTLSGIEDAKDLCNSLNRLSSLESENRELRETLASRDAEIERLREENKWIDAKERLPENHGRIFVYREIFLHSDNKPHHVYDHIIYYESVGHLSEWTHWKYAPPLNHNMMKETNEDQPKSEYEFLKRQVERIERKQTVEAEAFAEWCSTNDWKFIIGMNGKYWLNCEVDEPGIRRLTTSELYTLWKQTNEQGSNEG